jgi:hypothetical protein
MKRKLWILIGVVVLVSLAGCLSAENPSAEADTTETTTEGSVVYEDVPSDGDVIRFIDEEAGTICYIYSKTGGYNGEAGISCMPIEDTDLTT